MKCLYLLILLLLLTLETSAQTASDSSGLLVLQKKWSINAINSSGSMLNTDPFQPITETRQVLQDRDDTLRQNAIRQKQGLPPEPQRVRIKKPEVQYPNEVSTSYTYQIKVQNNGAKTIQFVTWEYVFTNSTTNEEVGRHTFTSKTNLKPSEVDKLVIKLFAPPTQIIDAKDTGKKKSNLYVEQINIKAIQYTDGSIWEADSK
jgi:hypothetical protein